MFTRKSILNILKGGEKMRTLICALCLLVVASSAFAVPCSFDLYTGFNLVAMPNVPIDPVPANLLSGLPLDGMLAGYNPVTQSETAYSEWEPELFGNLLLGDGYWLTSEGNTTITYEGVESGVPSGGVKTDMWISLPGFDSDFNGTPDAGGWHCVGNPYAEAVSSENFRFTDGVPGTRPIVNLI